MTIINGYSELLLDSTNPGDPARVSLEEIKKAGQRAAALTRQLIAFSRQQVLTLQIFDLNVAVADRVSNMQDDGQEVTPTKPVVLDDTDITLKDEQALTMSGGIPPSDKRYDAISDVARMKRFNPSKGLTTNDEEELVRRGIVAPPGRQRS